LKGLTEFLAETFKGKVEKVEISTSLVDSPAALVQGAYGMSPSMQKYMAAQAVAMGEEESMQGMMGNMNQVVLEINSDHAIIQKLEAMRAASGDNNAEVVQLASTLYDVAAMSSGYDIEDPAAFTKRVLALMMGVGGEVEVGVDVPKDAEVV